MPGGDGFVFLEHLRRCPKAAATPVIMLTAMSESGDIDRAQRLGVVDSLVKPFDPQPGGTGADIGEGGIAFTTHRVLRYGEFVSLRCPELFQQVGIQAESVRVRVVHVSVPEKGPRRIGAVFIGGRR